MFTFSIIYWKLFANDVINRSKANLERVKNIIQSRQIVLDKTVICCDSSLNSVIRYFFITLKK